MKKIKIAIVGYGNLGRGVLKSIKDNKDMELYCIVSRRRDIVVDDVAIIHIDDIKTLIGKVDVMILCSGSAKDLPTQSPLFAKYFNIVDSFDNHSQVNNHFNNVNEISLQNNTAALICAGWDPGMFSINRLYSNSILPNSKDYTFWGLGVSQGHSDAIRQIDGVLDARQYTIPIKNVIDSVRLGETPNLKPENMHKRKCFVVCKPFANYEKIANTIKSMPAYFEKYDTEIEFIDEEELKNNHMHLPHGGFVIHSGKTGENRHIIEYSLKLDSNPEFTANVLLCYARAVYRLSNNKDYGAKTVFDIPPSFLSSHSSEYIRKNLL